MDKSRKIRVIIVDDHAILREGLKTLLDLSDGIEVVGGAASGEEAIDQVARLLPDIALMDIAMPAMDGIECTRRITKLYPGVRVLILSQHENQEYILSAIKAGACGYILKKALSTDLISAIKAVHYEGYYFYPSITNTVIKDYLKHLGSKQYENGYDRLSEREKEALKLIAEGHSTSDIAQMLFVSVKTVLGHRTNIMGKLNIHNRTELVKYAIRKGLIQTGS
jgi:DNA-binding NarL/FixJ family response regulator